MSLVSEWSKVPAQNGTRGSPPNYWPEGQAPSTVNDCARLMMSTLRIQWQDAAWLDWGFTCTKIAGNKFSILVYTSSATTSVADRWVVGRRLKFFDTSTLYGTISEVSASASTYNVTATMDGTNSLSASFSSVALSIINPNENIIPAGQTIYQNGSQIYAAANSGTDAYTVTLNPVPTSYINGFVINFKADVANTGAATLNVNGLGAIAITSQYNQPLVTGDIVANQIVSVVYNSTGPTFQMQSQTAKVRMSQSGAEIFGADAGATDAYAISLTPAITSYVTGQMVNFTANTANTGAATLNVNGLGAKTIKKQYNQDLATGDILAGQIVTVVYDGTNFELQSLPGSGGGSSAATQAEMESASSTTVYSSPGRQQYHPGHPKAWCTFNGTTTGTNAPSAGYNVSTVTRNGTGDYTVNLTTSFSSATYCVALAMINSSSLNSLPGTDIKYATTLAAGSFTFNTHQGNGNFIDAVQAYAVAWGDQ